MRIILLGATGLVGNHLLAKLLSEKNDSQTANKILVLGRNKPEVRPEIVEQFEQGADFLVSLVKTDLIDEEKTAQLISNFQSQSPQNHSNSDMLICCLGTTLKAAGSRKAFTHVDLDLVISSAKAAKASGIKRMMLISAINANADSGVFYSRVKGQVEQALKAIGFSQLIIIKPSLLMGQRKAFRFSESLSAPIMKLINPILLGGLKKYRSVEGDVVAECMLKQLANPKQGVLEVYPTDY